MTLPSGSTAAYLRISIDRKGEAVSTTRQGKRAREIAAKHGLPVPVEYLEPGSTSASKRRGKKSAYAGLLADVRAGRVQVVIVWDLDRLTRQPDEMEEWLKLCERHGVRIITMDGEVDTTSPNGRLFLRIKADVSRHEVEHKAARQRDANRDRAEAGKPWTGGRRAYGYTADYAALVEPEASNVRAMFTDVLAGVKLRTIVARLNAAGQKTTRGLPWTTPGLRVVLHNPTYAGRRRLNGVEVADLTGAPAIVDYDTFAAVQTIIDDPARLTSSRGGRGPLYLLSGVARCGLCGAKVHGGKGSSRGRSWRLWRCAECLRLSRKAEPIEEYVTEVVLARLRRKDAAKLFRATAPDLGPLRQRAGELRAQRAALAADLDVDLDFAKARDRRLRAELEKVDAEIAAKSGKSALRAFAGGRDPGEVWDELDLDARREVVRELVEVDLLPAGRGRQSFDPDTVRITPRRP